MKILLPEKLEIFLFLALRHMKEAADDSFPEFVAQLPESEVKQFDNLWKKYLSKSEDEKSFWLDSVRTSIGKSDFSIDDTIHRSHIDAALASENSAVQAIIRETLPSSYRDDSKQNSTELSDNLQKSRSVLAIEKTIRKAFANQFVALNDLPEIKTFDLLSGAQLARLIRLAGIREVTFACARIESVESLAAFLRRFAPEDARAIATHLSSLPKIADERITFAENIVQQALENESQPTSAMLDWLGIRLIGIVLCSQEESVLRTSYTEQKFPLETVPALSEIIETQCRRTPDELKRKIDSEIRELAEVVYKSDGKVL